MAKNKWDSLLADLERKGTLPKDLVALLLHATDDPIPQEIRNYLAEVLTGRKTWRTGNPDAAYKAFKQGKKRKWIKAVAEPRIKKYMADGLKEARALAIVEAELEQEYGINRSAVGWALYPRKQRKKK